jgi:hypothetical protein
MSKPATHCHETSAEPFGVVNVSFLDAFQQRARDPEFLARVRRRAAGVRCPTARAGQACVNRHWIWSLRFGPLEGQQKGWHVANCAGYVMIWPAQYRRGS